MAQLDASQIPPTEIATSVPSLFSLNGWNQSVGRLTSTVEGWFGTTTPETNSATAALAAQAPNGTPAASVAGGSTLLGYIEAPFKYVGSEAASAYAGTTGFFSGIGGGVTSTISGTVSLVKWLVVGLVAFAVIYILSTLRVLKI